MVGGRGWGEANGESIPGKRKQQTSMDLDERMSDGAAADAVDEAEDDVEMLVQPEGEDMEENALADQAQPSSAEVLDEIMPEKPEEGATSTKDRKAAPTETEENAEPQVKVEESEERNAEGDGDAEGEVDAEGEADADGEMDAEGEEDAEGEVEFGEATVGLDDIPAANEVEAQRADSPGARQPPPVPASNPLLHKRFANIDELLLFRRPILELGFEDQLVNVDATIPTKPQETSSAQDDSSKEEESNRPPYLTDLFPDLAVYSGPPPPDDGKLHKRFDEGQTTSHRVAHTSRLMDVRPIFVSTLQPAANHLDDAWNLQDGPWFEDPKGSTDVSEDVVAASWGVFSGRGYRSLNSKHTPSVPTPPGYNLRHQHVWTEEEDAVLIRLVHTYPYNWPLIADSFNSEILSIPTDKVSAFDCYDRWHWTYGENKGKPRPEPQASTSNGPNKAVNTPGVPAVPSSAAATPAAGSTAGTPGAGPSSAAPASANVNGRPGAGSAQATPGGISVPTLPTQNGAAATEDGAPPPPGLSKRDAKQAARSKYEGSKSVVRHLCQFDSMRRLVRRREQARQKNAGELLRA